MFFDKPRTVFVSTLLLFVLMTTRCCYRLRGNFIGQSPVVKSESVLNMRSLLCLVLFTEEMRSASAVAFCSISRERFLSRFFPKNFQFLCIFKKHSHYLCQWLLWMCERSTPTVAEFMTVALLCYYSQYSIGHNLLTDSEWLKAAD